MVVYCILIMRRGGAGREWYGTLPSGHPPVPCPQTSRREYYSIHRLKSYISKQFLIVMVLITDSLNLLIQLTLLRN